MPFPAVIEDTRVVSAQALVAWHGNSYSVPPGHGGQKVTVRHQLGAATIDVVTAAGRCWPGTAASPTTPARWSATRGTSRRWRRRSWPPAAQEGRPCHRKERRPPSAEAMAEAAAIRGQAGAGRAGHRLRRVGRGRQAAAPGGEQGRPRPARNSSPGNARHHQEGGFTMSFAVPAAAGRHEPEISVPVSVIGDAAELLALVAELIDTAPGVSREQDRGAPGRARAPSPARPPTG